MPLPSDDFYRIKKLPPYVFAVINELKAKARAANLDIIDMGMGNPDGATPQPVVDKLIEAARNPRNHRYSCRAAFRSCAKPSWPVTRSSTMSRSIPKTEAIVDHRRQRRFSASVVRHHRARRCGRLGESRLSDSSIRRDHGRRRCVHAADARRRHVPRGAEAALPDRCQEFPK